MKYQVQLFKMSESSSYRLGIPIEFLDKIENLHLQSITFRVLAETLRDVWGLLSDPLPQNFRSRYIGDDEIEAKKLARQTQSLLDYIVATYFEEEEKIEEPDSVYTIVQF